jgi:hypothetical protein
MQVGVGCCFDWVIRLLGPLLLAVATVLILLVVYLYYGFILPAFAKPGSVKVSFSAVRQPPLPPIASL